MLITVNEFTSMNSMTRQMIVINLNHVIRVIPCVKDPEGDEIGYCKMFLSNGEILDIEMNIFEFASEFAKIFNSDDDDVEED